MSETLSSDFQTGVAGMPSGERRAWVRQACELEAFYRPLGEKTTLAWAATILDLSKGGISLLCSRRFTRGTYLMVEREGDSPDSRHVRLGRVIHLRAPHDSDRWIIGCAFVSKLNDEELRGWLA